MLGRRERERDVQQQLLLAGRGQVGQERALLDRLVGDRVLPCGCPGRSRGCRRRRGRPGRRRSGSSATPPRSAWGRWSVRTSLLPPVDQAPAGSAASPLLEERVEDAPIGAVPRDQDHSWTCGRDLSLTWRWPGECIKGGRSMCPSPIWPLKVLGCLRSESCTRSFERSFLAGVSECSTQLRDKKGRTRKM